MASRWRTLILTVATLTMAPTQALTAFAQEAPEGPQETLNQLDNAYSPEEGNILINPRHPDARRIKARKVRRWQYDHRLKSS